MSESGAYTCYLEETEARAHTHTHTHVPHRNYQSVYQVPIIGQAS